MTPSVTVTSAIGPTAGEEIADAIRDVLARQRVARLGVPGGRTPVAVFRWLADHLPEALAERLVVTFVDERHDPAPRTGDWTTWNPDSNERLVFEHWISRTRTPPRVVSFHAEGPLDVARAAVGERFASEVGQIDIALIGAGSDGHIASLFPGHIGLEDPGPIVGVSDSPKPPPERLSLALPIIAAAASVLLVVTGADKADMIARAYQGDASLPLGRLQPTGVYRWVIDAPAAQQLSLERA
ncbi:MAG: 6-phosphogluconolactonase [Myxococcota bacterium]